MHETHFDDNCLNKNIHSMHDNIDDTTIKKQIDEINSKPLVAFN